MTDFDAAERRHRAAQRAESEERYRKNEERRREDDEAYERMMIEILSRPADWVLPDEHNTYGDCWWVFDDAPCNERVCVSGRCIGSIHRVLGCWYRNEERTFWTFYPNQLPSENDEQRFVRLTKTQRKTENAVGRRARLDWWMTKDAEGREPDVEVFCSAKIARGRCNEKIARVWHTSQGYLLVGHFAPSTESIPYHLERGMQALDIDKGAIGKAFAASAVAWAEMLEGPDRPDLIPFIGQLNDTKPGDGMPPWLLLGCPRHFNAAIDYPTMREWVKEARRAGKGVKYDCLARTLGTIDWTASE